MVCVSDSQERFPKLTRKVENSIFSTFDYPAEKLVNEHQNGERKPMRDDEEISFNQKEVTHSTQNLMETDQKLSDIFCNKTSTLFATRQDSVFVADSHDRFEDYYLPDQVGNISTNNSNSTMKLFDDLLELQTKQNFSAVRSPVENCLPISSNIVSQIDESQDETTDAGYHPAILQKIKDSVDAVNPISNLKEDHIVASRSLLMHPVSNTNSHDQSRGNDASSLSIALSSSSVTDTNLKRGIEDCNGKQNMVKRKETTKFDSELLSLKTNKTRYNLRQMVMQKKQNAGQGNISTPQSNESSGISCSLELDNLSTKDPVSKLHNAEYNKKQRKVKGKVSNVNLKTNKATSIEKQVHLPLKKSAYKTNRINTYCKDCEHTFKYRKNYERHKKEGKCRHVCEYCGKVFLHGSTGAYEVHLKYHREIRNYECKVCGKTYVEYRKLKVHSRSHTGEKPYMCCECGLTFPGFCGLYSHRKLNHQEKRETYPCPFCTKSFKGLSGLKFHVKYYHEAKSDSPFLCSKCAKTFKTPELLKRHETIHEEIRKFKCDQCNASFKRIQGLSEHKIRHTKSYRHFCSQCGKGCYTKQTLMAHERTHSGEKPYSCKICDYKCAVRGNLTKHLKVHEKL